MKNSKVTSNITELVGIKHKFTFKMPSLTVDLDTNTTTTSIFPVQCHNIY